MKWKRGHKLSFDTYMTFLLPVVWNESITGNQHNPGKIWKSHCSFTWRSIDWGSNAIGRSGAVIALSMLSWTVSSGNKQARELTVPFFFFFMTQRWLQPFYFWRLRALHTPTNYAAYSAPLALLLLRGVSVRIGKRTVHKSIVWLDFPNFLMTRM